jgi:methyltransferase-like protein/2-polyprenyl-3-methyl-5-hydroxy-6-metoxy-1,4-benzoquinol methylase
MSQTEEFNACNALTYPPCSYSDTHIGRLGAIGRLFNLQTADPANARVLELGCSSGINLLAMAQLFPSSEFIGIDNDKRQIDLANQALEATGLSNVKFLNQNILKISENLGAFDFIIARGIYSWVPANVKDAIFRISSENLKPNGIAYISYNCLPGWRMRGALRDMMLMHTASISNIPEKVAQSKALIKFLAESCFEDTPYGKYLRQELDLLNKMDDCYIVQDFLEVDNDALYFRDFLESAAKYNLAYLGDSDPSTMIVDNLPLQTAETIKSLNINLIETEQYMDFVRNRMFRSTLLCHSDSLINRNIDPLKIIELQVSSHVTLNSYDSNSESAVFHNQEGVQFCVTDAFTATIFAVVANTCYRPRPIKTIINECLPILEKNKNFKDTPSLPSAICQILLKGYFRKMLDFSISNCSVPFLSDDKPEALPLSRWQASNGHRLSASSLRMIQPDPCISKIVTLCDGSRSRKEIGLDLAQAVIKKEFVLKEHNQSINGERLELVIDGIIDGSILELSRHGILMQKPA